MDAILLGQKTSLRYPNPTRYLFSTYWLIPSFLLKINAFLMWSEIWKGRKKVRQKADSNPDRLHQKEYNTLFTICATRTDD